jgi:hypothetical protein
VALDYLSRGHEAPGVGDLLWCQPSRSLVEWILHGDPCLYRGELIRCQSDHVDYACFHGGVAMSGGNGMDPNTRVPICQVFMGTCDKALSCLALSGFTTQGPQLLGHLPGA